MKGPFTLVAVDPYVQHGLVQTSKNRVWFTPAGLGVPLTPEEEKTLRDQKSLQDVHAPGNVFDKVDDLYDYLDDANLEVLKADVSPV